jgi:hypothetical protein
MGFDLGRTVLEVDTRIADFLSTVSYPILSHYLSWFSFYYLHFVYFTSLLLSLILYFLNLFTGLLSFYPLFLLSFVCFFLVWDSV